MGKHIISFPAEPIGPEPAYSRKRVAIMVALATGWLPWGVEWKSRLPLCDKKYILCCGHAWGRREAQRFADAGLIKGGEDESGRPALFITARGLTWLGSYWV